MDQPVAPGDTRAGRRGETAGASPVHPPPDGSRLRPPTPRVALVIAAAVVVGFLLYLGRDAVGPFVVGLLLVYLLHPAVEWLSRHRVPRWAAVLIVYIVTTFILLQAVGFMIRPLLAQIRTFAADLPSLVTQAQDMYRGLDIPPALREAIDGWLVGIGEGSGNGGFDPGILLPVVNITAGFISALFGFIIIPVWAFYLLKDQPRLTAAFDRTLPEAWRGDVWEIVRIVERVFGQWVRGQLFLGVTVGLATFVGLLILNATVDPIFGRFALLLAVSAGILELLPIIGPIIAAVPAVLLALTAGPGAAVAALILYLLVQQVENNLLVPKIQGDAVEMHPSAVMFSLVVGGAIAGLLGAILALPVTAAGRDVFGYLFHRVSNEPRDPAAALPEPGKAADAREATAIPDASAPAEAPEGRHGRAAAGSEP